LQIQDWRKLEREIDDDDDDDDEEEEEEEAFEDFRAVAPIVVDH
jgi:hypothetical protein